MTKGGEFDRKERRRRQPKVYDSPSCVLSIICCQSSRSRSSSSRKRLMHDDIRASAYISTLGPQYTHFSSIHHMLGGLSTTNGKRTPGTLSWCRHALKCCIVYIYFKRASGIYAETSFFFCFFYHITTTDDSAAACLM